MSIYEKIPEVWKSKRRGKQPKKIGLTPMLNGGWVIDWNGIEFDWRLLTLVLFVLWMVFRKRIIRALTPGAGESDETQNEQKTDGKPETREDAEKPIDPV